MPPIELDLPVPKPELDKWGGKLNAAILVLLQAVNDGLADITVADGHFFAVHRDGTQTDLGPLPVGPPGGVNKVAGLQGEPTAQQLVDAIATPLSAQIAAVNDQRYVFKAPAPTGDKATDEANVQPLVTQAQATSGGTVLLQAGTYVMDLTTAAGARQPIIRGMGEKRTKVDGTISMVGTPGAFSGGYLQDFGFVGTRAAGAAFLKMSGTVGVRGHGIGFDGNADIGILFENAAGRVFTEACAIQANFNMGTKTAIEYRVSAGGNPSFHGCGLLDGSTINQTSTDTGPKILIGAGAEPYNAPLTVTMWARTNQPLIRHDGLPSSSFYGQMKIELLPPNAYAVIVDPASTNTILPFVGGLSRRGKSVRLGKLAIGEEVRTENLKARIFRGGAERSTTPGKVMVINADGRAEWAPRARVNRAKNPMVGNGLYGFSGYNGASTAQVDSTVFGGTKACRITTSASPSQPQGFAYMEPNTDLAQGQVKTVSFDILSPVDGIMFAGGRFGLSGSPGVAEVGEDGATGDIEYVTAGETRRVVRKVTVPAPNSGGTITHEGMYLRFNAVGGTGGQPSTATEVLVSNIQIEDGETTGSRFYPGDTLGTNWDGLVHNSRSTLYPTQPIVPAGEVAYTPTLINGTLGAGEMVAYYSKVGKRVTGSFYMKAAADTVLSGGTFGFSLPDAAPLVAGSKRRYAGSGFANDFSATERFIIDVLPSGTTGLTVRCIQAGTGGFMKMVGVGSAAPFTWAVNDELLVEFEYETA